MVIAILDKIFSVITLIFGVLLFYKTVYIVIGLFSKSKKYPHCEKQHKFAVIISARNEEKVIGNLIESITKQDYDLSKVSVFVVADNCTDNTAMAVNKFKDKIDTHVYERFDNEHKTKGYALEYLFENIKKDYGYDAYDAYVFFDADNLIPSNFLTKMNDAYAGEEKVVVGYRSSKNFDTNIVSSAHGIHFYKQSFFSNRPRAALGLNTNITGTGFLVDNRVIAEQDGWHYVLITEDHEFSINLLSKGVKVDFCEEAEFFDEQPVTLKMSVRQRLRWIRGTYDSLFSNGHKLIKAMFSKNKFAHKFICYDFFFHYFPHGVYVAFTGWLYPIIKALLSIFIPSISAVAQLKALGLFFLTMYMGSLFLGTCVAIKERKHIPCSNFKLFLHVLAFPWLDITFNLLQFTAITMKITWKPIEHKDETKIENLDAVKEDNASEDLQEKLKELSNIDDSESNIA